MFSGIKNREIDQKKRTESPEISSYIYGQLIFNKDGKTIQWGKEILQKMMLDNWISTCTPYIKINSKWIIYLNVTVKTIKLLGENTGIKLHDLELAKAFLDVTPKSQMAHTHTKKKKINKASSQ